MWCNPRRRKNSRSELGGDEAILSLLLSPKAHGFSMSESEEKAKRFDKKDKMVWKIGKLGSSAHNKGGIEAKKWRRIPREVKSNNFSSGAEAKKPSK